MMSPAIEARPESGDAVADALLAKREPEPPSEVSLTTAEQRLVSVIIVAVPPQPRVGPDDETSEVPAGALHVFARHGARVERLLNGALVGLISDQASELPVRAGRCALGLWRESPHVPIAVATGRADLSKRSAMSEIIEVAAALAKGDTGGILVDDTTRSLLEGRFDFVDGRLSSELPPQVAARQLLGRSTPYVGRESELDTLVTFAARAFRDGAGAMLVTGPPGVGKSRLRYELIRRAARDLPSCDVWCASGDMMNAGSPYDLAAQLLVHAMELRQADTPTERATKIGARIRALGLPARVATFLRTMLGSADIEGAGADMDLARRDARLMRDQVSAACVAWLVAETERRPLLIVIDDMQWGDRPSVALIDAALETEAALAVVAFARPDVRAALPNLWSERTTSELRLGPLGKRAARELARAVLGGAPESVIERVVEVSAGNAFYLEELLRMAASGRQRELPPTVLAMNEARLERLAPTQRMILRAASIFGQSFWPTGVALLTGMSADQVNGQLAALTSDELVTVTDETRFAGERQLRFRHALMREAAYATLTEDDRRLGHDLAADWLTKQGERDHRVLVEHLERSTRPASAAAPHLVRLAEQALEAGDWDAAGAWAEQARAKGASGADLGRAMLVLAEMAMWQGRKGGDAADLAVASFPEGSEDWCRAVSVAAVHATRTSRHEIHRDLQERVLRVSSGGEVADHVVVALAQLTFATISASQPATMLVRRLESLRDRRYSPYVRARVEHALFLWKMMAGGLADEDFERLDAALEELEALGDVRGATQFRGNLAFGRLNACKLEEATRDCERVLAAAEKFSLPHIAIASYQGRATVALDAGRHDDARALLEDARTRLVHDVRLHADLSAVAARTAAAQGDFDTAEKYAELGLRSTQPGVRAVALAARANVACARGKLDEGITLATEARDSTLAEHTDVGDIGHAYRTLIDLLRARGDEAEARRVAAEGYERISRWAVNLHDWRTRLRRNVDFATIIDCHEGRG